MSETDGKPSSDSGGTVPMTIARRMVRERERCIGMTEEERAWRRKWIQDQILAPNEPVYVPELEREFLNPIRRFYRKPLDVVFNKLQHVLGEDRTILARVLTGRFMMLVFGVFATHYYFKYNGNDWTRQGGFSVWYSRPMVLPGEPGWPKPSDRNKPSDYADRGFKNSPI